jgi:glycosyltransferase involved in cell wall biosynthesis
MKIVHLVAGAGGMYCGSCLHANTLAAALITAGEDLLMAPVYAPIRTDEESVSIDRVLFGGLNVYLQQKLALFRHTPWFLDRLLDRPWLLGRLARRGAGTSPERLGDLTVSMLRGEEGRQRKELDKLLRWLRKEARPDVVHLSNVLLVGMARQITRQLDVPVVCTLSGEDMFLDQLFEPDYTEAREVLRQRCGDLAAMVSLNHYYADFMAEYLAVERRRIHVIPAGLNLAGHLAATPDDGPPKPPAGPPTIGFLSRICPEKGFGQLAEAFALLAGEERFATLRLVAAGFLGAGDKAYLARITGLMASYKLGDRFRYAGALDRPGKIAMLQSLSVMCLPTTVRESKGLPVLEAWANGVPVVVPAHGVFPELIADTGGGLLYRPGDAVALADALRRLLENPELAAEYGRRGLAAVRERYHAQLMAQRTIELYRQLCPTSPA